MYDIIRSICDNISTLNDIPHCMWHHIHCIYEITPSIYSIKSTVYDITSSVHGTSQPLYLCHHTYSIDDVTTSQCMTSHLVYVGHHMHYTWHAITLYDFKPQYLWHHIHHLSHQIYCIQHHICYTCDITARVSKTSNWLYVWNQTNMCEISYALYDITATLFYIRAMFHILRETHTLREGDKHWQRQTHTQWNTHIERHKHTLNGMESLRE